MRNRFGDELVADHGLRNVRFLLAQQVLVIDTLGQAGRDIGEAVALLRKLMDIETALLTRTVSRQRPARQGTAAA